MTASLRFCLRLVPALGNLRLPFGDSRTHHAAHSRLGHSTCLLCSKANTPQPSWRVVAYVCLMARLGRRSFTNGAATGLKGDTKIRRQAKLDLLRPGRKVATE